MRALDIIMCSWIKIAEVFGILDFPKNLLSITENYKIKIFFICIILQIISFYLIRTINLKLIHVYKLEYALSWYITSF